MKIGYLLVCIGTIIGVGISTMTVTSPIDVAHRRGPKNMAHSMIARQIPVHYRHQLSANRKEKYLVSNLTNTHISFTLPLKVAGVDYHVNVDTGSSDIFIKGQGSKGKPQRKYDCKECQQGQHILLGYLDGYLDAYVQDLPISFAGKHFDAELLIATRADPQFEDVEGICGLSYPDIAHNNPTFIETLISNRIIDQYAYGLVLNLIQDNRSLISFGQPDPNLYQGRLGKHPMISQQSFFIRFHSMRIGKGPRIRVSRALLDTGNTCISIPIRFTWLILPGFNTKNNHCQFSEEENIDTFKLLLCRVGNFDQLPILVFRIGTNRYEITKQYYIQNCMKRGNKHFCSMYIETVDLFWEPDTIFLGDSFFNRFYTHFDLENQVISIAKNKQDIDLQDILKLPADDMSDIDWQQLM